MESPSWFRPTSNVDQKKTNHQREIHYSDDDDDDVTQRCRHCLSSSSASLYTDWAQGDRVCINCGIVQEERLCETRPEWRQYAADSNENNNGSDGGSMVRCGLVPNDESKYWGGLEPTTLSSQVFGGGSHAAASSSSSSASAWRKRLLATQRKIERMMQQEHVRSMKDAKLAQQWMVARRKRQQQPPRNHPECSDDEDDDDDEFDNNHPEVRPDYEQLLLREEEEAQRVHATLYAAKWSLDRALLLHGGAEGESNHQTERPPTAARDELWQQLDKSLRQASADIYQAYTMLTQAAQQLELPQRITREALHMLCRYATKRDGLLVKGVSSRIVSMTSPNSNTTSISSHTNHRNIKTTKSEKKDESILLAQRLREYNKLKQIGSLCSAFLFLSARSLGWTRSLLEVCDSFQGTLPNNDHDDATTTATTTSLNKDTAVASMSFIKPKHCSRAMNEIKKVFPDFGRSVVGTVATNHTALVSASATTTTTTSASPSTPAVGDDEEATSNFVTHSLRKLHLPPVAEESVRALVQHCRQEQVTLGRDSGMKLATLNASLAYLVCVAGTCMQRLAEQGRSATTPTAASSSSSSWMGKSNFTIPRKRLGTAAATTTAATSSQSQQRGSTLSRKRPASHLLEQPSLAKVPRMQPAAIKSVQPQLKQEQQAPVTIESSSPGKSDRHANKRRKLDIKLEDCDNLFDDPVEKTSESSSGSKILEPSTQSKNESDDTKDVPFDVFSHPAVVASDVSERQAYEMRRMWDTWAEQMSWTRSLGEIENSCGVSKSVILETYQSKLYPRRVELLQILRASVDKSNASLFRGAAANTTYSTTTGRRTLAATPLAPTLLSHITAAASLLSKKEKF